MHPNSPSSSGSAHPTSVRRRGHAAFVPLLALAGCFFLSACGGSSSDPSTAAAVHTPVHHLSRRERAELVEMVKCARHHGIHLPEPNSEGQVLISRSYLADARRKATIYRCLDAAARETKRKERASVKR